MHITSSLQFKPDPDAIVTSKPGIKLIRGSNNNQDILT